MADLDDFFAKKDKKKAKAKPKFLTAEELVKKLEREAAAAKPKKPEPTVAVTVTAAPAATAAPGIAVAIDDGKNKIPEEPVIEEEWDEFAEEKRKDYSGLKIGQLTINDEEEQSPAEGDEDDVDSDGNTNAPSHVNMKRGPGGGPWKKVIPAEEVTQIPMEMEKPTSKVYISPALRHSQAMNNTLAGSRMKVRGRAAPDITNADYFPTLGAARPEEQRKKKNEPAFEEVRHGGRMQRVQAPSAAVPSAAANRFQSLDEDDS